MDDFVRDGDIELAVQSFGDCSRPPIILAMGATASMMWWPDELCQGLADRGHFVIRYDNRDTGRSTSLPLGHADYTVEDMAADLVAIIDRFGFPSVDIVGMSLGGLIGQMVAVTHSTRVRTLTLIGAQPLGWDGAPLPDISPAFLAHFGKIETLDWNDRGAVIDFLLENARLSAGAHAMFDAARERRRIECELARTTSISSAFNHSSLTFREDWTGRGAMIKSPVLILHGADDPIVPIENGRAIAATIPFARLHPLVGVGHELPASTIPLLVEFIATFVGKGSGISTTERPVPRARPVARTSSDGRRSAIDPFLAGRRNWGEEVDRA